MKTLLSRPLRRFFRPLKRFLIRAQYFPLVETTTKSFASFLAPIIRLMASTGAGTDACLRRGCLPMSVDYYSPVPDVTDLARRKVWDHRSELSGIDFSPDAQVAFLKKLGNKFGHECDWPPNPTNDPYRFYTENNTFSFGCAASTHCILRAFKPRRVVEVGSGNSSLIISRALLMNAKNAGVKYPEYTVIDPYPGSIVKKNLPGFSRLIKKRVELLDVNFFEQLDDNDVLFIDSGHTVRIGGDVNFLILDILPRLAPGVIVHFHDIGLPYEYPKVYATNRRFRVFWTEAYLLQAFLCHNSQYEIMLAVSYLMSEQKEAFRAAFPFYDPKKHVSTSGSFWIRRR